MKPPLLVVVLSLAFGSMNVAAAQARDCSVSDAPFESTAWARFEHFVQQEYIRDKAFEGEDAAVVFGHALGRAARAVGTDPARMAAFDCLYLALEEAYLIGQCGLFDTTDLFQLVHESAMGLHDAWVSEISGVISNAPANEPFIDPPAAYPSNAAN